MDHSFNIDVAKDVGIAPAVLLNNIYWWVDKNEKNNINYFDGKYWTYNKKSAYLAQFPYLSESQLERALVKLRDAGYLEVGNYNKVKYDRTLWYTLTEKAYDVLQIKANHSAKMRNGKDENEEPIQDINKDINKDNSLSKDKEEQAPETKVYKNYGEIFSDNKNTEIRVPLEKFVNSLKNKHGYNPKVTTVAKFADTLRNLSSNNSELAMRIVEQSIDKGWKDLYKLKDKHSRDAISKVFNPEKDVLAKDTAGNNVVY